jgi:hypothetical protein
LVEKAMTKAKYKEGPEARENFGKLANNKAASSPEWRLPMPASPCEVTQARCNTLIGCARLSLR